MLLMIDSIHEFSHTLLSIRWFMPLNILLTFVIGSILALVLNKVARTPQHLQGLVIGCCAAGLYMCIS